MKNIFIIKLCLILLPFFAAANVSDFSITEIYKFEGDGKTLFGVTDLIPLDDDSFVISDMRMKRILKVNRDGELVRLAGRDGRGPGEFSGGAHQIIENGGLLYVFDMSSLKIAQVFDHDLNYVTTIQTELARDAIAINDSVMLLHYHNYQNDKYLHLHNYDGALVSSVDHEVASEEYVNLNYANVVSTGNGKFVIVYRHLNRIEYYNTDFSLCTILSIASLPDESPVYQMPGSAKIAARFEGRQRNIVESASYRPEFLIYKSSAADRKGNVYIQVNSELWDSDENIIVLDQRGSQTGSFVLPGNQKLMAIGRDDRLYSRSATGDAVYVYQINRES